MFPCCGFLRLITFSLFAHNSTQSWKGHVFHNFGRLHEHQIHAFSLSPPAVDRAKRDFLRFNTFFLNDNIGPAQVPEPLTKGLWIS